jgi:hypothetical protein
VIVGEVLNQTHRCMQLSRHFTVVSDRGRVLCQRPLLKGIVKSWFQHAFGEHAVVT